MKKYNIFLNSTITIILVMMLQYVSAQNVQLNNRVLKQHTVYSELSGSPYLTNDWTKGSIILGDGKVVENLDIKFDQFTDAILYKNDNGEELEVAEPVKEFKVKIKNIDRLFRAGFKPVGSNTETNFYEVLVDGSLKFLKRFKKEIMTTRDYNATSDTKTVTEKISYYIVKDNQPILVLKNEKAILEAIGEKENELNDFIKQNKLKLKDEGDIIKIIEQYNKLKKAG
jgi:hypothetical protein